MTKRKYTKGFTLVELLVVIAIIAILAGAMFLVINPAKLMMKARDAKRVAELTELNKGLALALADTKITITAMPTPGSSTCMAGKTFVVDGTGWVTFTGTLSGYIAALPKDPLNVAPNCYVYAANAAGEWELDASLESADNNAMEAADGGNAAALYELGTNKTLLP